MGDKQSSKKIAFRKCVEFYSDDIELIKFIHELEHWSVSFSDYVRELIKKDLNEYMLEKIE